MEFLFLLIPLIIILGCIITRAKERKNFNHGRCPHCGSELIVIDMDSQGGKLWKCKNCGHTMWTSWV